jgi:hypothetical protein
VPTQPCALLTATQATLVPEDAAPEEEDLLLAPAEPESEEEDEDFDSDEEDLESADLLPDDSDFSDFSDELDDSDEEDLASADESAVEDEEPVRLSVR